MTFMSSQRSTPSGFTRRVPGLVIALALGSWLWSCESEQTGYDVTIPLIGPIEFDETSCEISGDICSTDSECFDEDGFNVGPCTKTLTELSPITVAVSLSPVSPSYTLPTPDTGRWVAPLAVLQNTDSNPIAITTENFSVTGGPVTLSVRPFSRIGLILGRDADYEPISPASCTFTLDDSSTGQDYTDGISSCLSDWVKQNGAPLEFDIEVTSSAGAAAKSGVVLKQLANYSVTGGDTWSTDRRCEGQKSEDVLDAVGEGSDFFDLLQCSGLEFSGSGSTDQQIEIFGVATVYDRCGNSLATSSLGSVVGERIVLAPSPPRYTVTVQESSDFTVENNVPVVFEPNAQTFVEYLFLASAGDCVSGSPVRAVGYALVDWEHCYAGEGEEPDRTGDLEFGAKGFCPVAEGAEAGGDSGQ
jgi:hypothetical protein